MTDTIATSEKLKRLLELDPGLTARLKEVEDVEALSNLILHSAEQQGVELDASALARELAPFSELLSQLVTLAQVMGAEPSLDSAVREAENIDEAIELITAAAQRQGISLDARALVEQMHSLSNQVPVGELSDDELAEVSGGSLAFTAGVIVVGAIAMAVGVGSLGAGFGLGAFLWSQQGPRG